MKPIYLDDQQKEKLIQDIIKSVSECRLTDGIFSFTKRFGNLEKHPNATLMYTADAYLKMKSLVDFYETEVFWHGLVKRLSDTEFMIYDILCPQQTVTGATVDTDEVDCMEFQESLTDEQANNLFMHGHSHVSMATTPSSTDLNHQKEIVHSLQQQGFYIFQIVNKQGVINTMIYDLDQNIYYDKNDVDLEIVDTNGYFISEFIAESKERVHKYVAPVKKTPAPEKKEEKKPKQHPQNAGRTLNRWDFDTDDEWYDYLEHAYGYIISR